MHWISIELPAALLVFGGIALAAVLVSQLPLTRFTGKDAPLTGLQESMGLSRLNGGVFFLILLFWAVLFGFAFLGLLMLIYDVLGKGMPDTSAEQADWRFVLTKVAAMTAVLGAVVALPFTLIRLNLSVEQKNHAAETLYNEKMNTAVADLHSQRQVTLDKDADGTRINGWQDDIPRRNGAIDRLKGLADERDALRPRIDRLLSVYLRELSREYPAQKPEEGLSPDQLRAWASQLKPARSDMENAAQTLSRLPRPNWQEGADKLPDLKKINMQKFDLSRLTFSDADLSGAQLQGANLGFAELQGAELGGAQLQGAELGGAQLQGANLFGAELQGAELRWAQLQGAELGGAQLQGADLFMAQLRGANLFGAELQGAELRWAQLQGADLSGAQLQGADLSGAQFDKKTDLTAATLRGAAVRSVDFKLIPQIADHLDGLFGDTSVKLPDGMDRPDRFNVGYKDWDDFLTAWRKFQHSIGQDPENPT